MPLHPYRALSVPSLGFDQQLFPLRSWESWATGQQPPAKEMEGSQAVCCAVTVTTALMWSSVDPLKCSHPKAIMTMFYIKYTEWFSTPALEFLPL
jgi:hypothetical protein